MLVFLYVPVIMLCHPFDHCLLLLFFGPVSQPTAKYHGFYGMYGGHYPVGPGTWNRLLSLRVPTVRKCTVESCPRFVHEVPRQAGLLRPRHDLARRPRLGPATPGSARRCRPPCPVLTRLLSPFQPRWISLFAVPLPFPLISIASKSFQPRLLSKNHRVFIPAAAFPHPP